MCTAVTYKTNDFYFGRNLDYETEFGESVVIMPRKYNVSMSNSDMLGGDYAVCGMAHVEKGFPLFYDAMNEKGLCAAGLNFVGNAFYNKPSDKKYNVAQYEFIPWLLARCANLEEAKKSINKMNMTDTPFSENLPSAMLHWLISDKTGSVTLEITKSGMFLYDNPVGVLTNNPPFSMQLFSLNNYMSLSSSNPENRFGDVELSVYSRGMGALGLPGDLSSQSRFIRACFAKLNSKSEPEEAASVSQFFHILGATEQQRGCCEVGKGKYEITIYSSCCNADKGIYYYKTYENSAITAVDMKKEKLGGGRLICYPLRNKQEVFFEN